MKKECKFLLKLHSLVGTPSGIQTTWGGVRTLENRRFDTLPKLTYLGNYPKQNNYHMSYISVKNNMLRILLTRSGFPVYYM